MPRKKRESKRISDHDLEEINEHHSKSDASRMDNQIITVKKLEFELTAKQKKLMRIIDNNKIITITGPPGTSKTFIACYDAVQALLRGDVDKIIISKPTDVLSGTKEVGFLPGPQPLSAKILTPTGWTTMGEIKKGDYVCTPDGNNVKVLETYNKGLKDIYEINTLYGKTEACGDHLWSTQTYNEHKQNKNFKIRNTTEILNTIKTDNNKYNHYLPKHNIINFNNTVLNIPPYVLGALLGDGSFCNESVIISSIDDEIIERIKKDLGELYNVKNYSSDDINYYITSDFTSRKKGRNVKITKPNGEILIFNNVSEAHITIHPNMKKVTFQNRCERQCIIDGYKYEFLNKNKKWSNEIKNNLEDLNLLGLKSYQKFIPDVYKYTSVENRIALLQGLLDTDGSCKLNGETTFGTSSYKLAHDVIEIIKSLGGNATLYIRDKTDILSKINDKDIICNHISYEVYISLTNNINPFHLSRKADRFKAKIKQHYNKIIDVIKHDQKQEAKCILIDHPDHLYITDNYIVTHNTLEEKMQVYIESFLDCFDDILRPQQFKHLWDNKTIEFKPAQFLRGRTLKKSFIIIDEFQNFDIKTLKSIVTRLGKGSKMVFMGDTKQNDIHKKYVAIDTFKEILEDVKGCASFEFERKDIVREQILIDIIDRFELFEDKGLMPETIKGA